MKRGMFVMVSILLLMTESDNSCELDTNDSKIAAIAEGLNDDWAKWEEAKCQAMMHVKGNNLEKIIIWMSILSCNLISLQVIIIQR